MRQNQTVELTNFAEITVEAIPAEAVIIIQTYPSVHTLPSSAVN